MAEHTGRDTFNFLTGLGTIFPMDAMPDIQAMTRKKRYPYQKTGLRIRNHYEKACRQMRNEPQRLNTVTTRTKEAMLNGLRLQMTVDDYCDCGTNNSAVIRPLQAEFCDTHNSPKKHRLWSGAA